MEEIREIKSESVCMLCGRDHKKHRLTTFEGAYGTYCIPLKKLSAFKEKLKNSQTFRTYLGVDDLKESSLYDIGHWKARHRFLETDLNTSCIHGISGGCIGCYPDSYCGSFGANHGDKR